MASSPHYEVDTHGYAMDHTLNITSDHGVTAFQLTMNVTVPPRGEGEENGGGSDYVPCGVFFFVVYGPLFGLVCLLGLIGNSLSFAVLHKYSRSNVATYLLKALAISDNIFLATASFVQMYPAMSMYFGLIEQYEPLFPYFQTYVWPVTHIVQMGTVYMMVLVAANRYIAVCYPLQAPRWCTKRHVQVQILAMTVAIVVYNTPRFFEYRYVTGGNDTAGAGWAANGTATTAATAGGEDLYEKNVGFASIRLYNILYENVAYVVFVFLLPLLVLIVFNAHLVRDLKRAQRSRKAMTSRSSQEENNITLVMIIIIIVFIVCQTPASINQILYYVLLESSSSSGGAQSNACTTYQRYSHVSNLLITMNSSMNFVIYCLFRRQFQQELLGLVCYGSRRRRAGAHPLNRTIVFKASYSHNNNRLDDPERSSSFRRSRDSTSTLRTVGAGGGEDVPLTGRGCGDGSRAGRGGGGGSSPGSQSHDTMLSRLSRGGEQQCNGKEVMGSQDGLV